MPSPHARDAGDARRYARRTVALTLVLYAILAAALLGRLSPWVFVVVLPLLYVRLSLALHELMHLRTAAQVSWFHALAMIFDTPLGLGYREHRAIHLRHHRHAGTVRDPELFQIEGGHLRALGCALVSPEYAAWRWVRERGLSRDLLWQAGVRGALFACLVALNLPVFAAYWATLRVCIGGASFVFHHLMHNRDGALGTFAFPGVPRRAVAMAQLAFGREPVTIVREHRAHHRDPSVRARDLARAA